MNFVFGVGDDGELLKPPCEVCVLLENGGAKGHMHFRKVTLAVKWRKG